LIVLFAFVGKKNTQPGDQFHKSPNLAQFYNKARTLFQNIKRCSLRPPNVAHPLENIWLLLRKTKEKSALMRRISTILARFYDFARTHFATKCQK